VAGSGFEDVWLWLRRGRRNDINVGGDDVGERLAIDTMVDGKAGLGCKREGGKYWGGHL